MSDESGEKKESRPGFIKGDTAKAQLWRSIVFLIVSTLLLLIPLETKTRPLVSPGVLRDLSLSELKLGPPIFGGGNLTYHMVVDMDLTEAGGVQSLEKLKSIDRQLAIVTSQTRAETHPYRYSKVLAIPIGTYGRRNECILTLSLGEGIVSQPLLCLGLDDNGLARFEFTKPIPPGIYSARIASSARDASQAVAPYVAEGADGTKWLLPQGDASSVRSLDAFRSMFAQTPLTAGLYIAAIFFLGLLFARGIGDSGAFLSAILLLTISVLLFTKPMSGHDETAHVTMLYHAVLLSGVQGTPPPEEFYGSVASYMLDNDFYRLHTSQPLQPGQCPHEILGGCGISDGPMRVYKVYAAGARFTGVDLRSPAALVTFGRVTNLLLTVVVLGAIWVLYSGSILAVIAITMGMTGGFLASLASITNDVPAFLVGFFALATGVHSLCRSEKRCAKSKIGYAVLLLAFGLLFLTDPSFIAGVPLVALLLLPAFIGRPLLEQEQRSRPQGKPFIAFIVFLTAFMGIILAARLLPWIIANDSSGISSTALSVVPHAQAILDYPTVNIADAFQAMVSYFKSLFGSFVWGHSYYHGAVYAVLFLAYSALLGRGLVVLSLRMTRLYCYVWVSAIGVLAALQVVAVVSLVAPFVGADAVTFDSYTKVRLTAPALASVWLLPGIGLRDMLDRPVMRRGVFLALILWSMIIALYYLPVFYFADLF